MKEMKWVIFAALSLFTAVTLTACGGGGGGGGGTTTPSGTVSTGFSKGVIEDKGSVVVNGVKFEITAATSIRVDDNPGGTEADLKRGMVVRVKGTFDDRTGTATEIEFDDNIQGPITAVNLADKTITVLGKVVKFEDNITRVNDDTAKVFGTGAANFKIDQRVEVSGFDDSTGAIRASRIDDRTGTTEVEVKGTVSALTGSTFTLTSGSSTFTVNFTVPLSGVTSGSFVEVRGTLSATGTTITALNTARGVTLDDDGIDDNVAKVEVEGIVTSGNAASFVINGITVVTSGATRFENGVAADVIPNIKVEAEGPMNNGVIIATKVSLRSNVRIQGLVTAVNGANLTVLGKTVTTTPNTDFRSFQGNPTTLADIVAGATRVEVRGFLDLNGNLVATRLDRTNDNKEFIMSPVTAKSGTDSLTLMFGNTPVTTDALTEFQVDNDDVNETPIARADFFNLVIPKSATAPGTVVKARLVPGTLVADELEIEGDR